MQKEIITKRQKEFLKTIYNNLITAGFPPSFAELKEKLKVSSNQTILDILLVLERKNLISREEGSARGIKILKKGYKAINVRPLAPVVGFTSAGSFTEAIEEIDAWQPLSKDVETIADDVMIVRVMGDSMINANINDGDLILFKKTNEFVSGDIVLAQTPDGTTVKRFISQNKPPYKFLKPENPKYKNIPFNNEMQLIGKMVKKNPIVPEQSKNITNNAEIEKPYYNNLKFKLFYGNCLDVLVKFPENSVDMVFADPPYLLSNGGFSVHAGRRVSVNKGEWDKSNGLKKDFTFHLEWIKAVRRILKPNGTIWISGTYHSIYQCGFALQAAGFHILNDISWFKPNASPNLSCRYFTASHETLLWARKDKKAKHIFNYNLMKNGNWPNDFIKKPGSQMRSVWAVGTPKAIEKKFGKHPTQKPEDLLKRIVLASTNKGDLVVDPFTGSSTTGIAAYLLGRNFIGIDTDKNYLDLSIKRFKELDRNLKNKFNFGVLIPEYVTEWTDKFFHQSSHDKPVSFPNKNIISFLSRFRKTTPIQLYRGINKYNVENNLITSWTYEKDVAARYIENGGKLAKSIFNPESILLDTTILNVEQKRQLGYDYKIDDKEVLIINN